MADQPTGSAPLPPAPKFTLSHILDGSVPVADVQKHGEILFKHQSSDPYSTPPDINQSILRGLESVTKPLFEGSTLHYSKEDQINQAVPDYIPKDYRETIYDTANQIGISPANLAALMRKENATYDPHAKGAVDPNDIGLMQINKANFPMIQKQFKDQMGMDFDPTNPYHSIMAAGMVLGEHKKSEFINNEKDLITSYNTGPKTIFKASQGDEKAISRVNAYQKGLFTQ